MKPDKKPPPTLAELLTERRALLDQLMRDAHAEMNDDEKAIASFLEISLAIDDLLAVKIKSADDAAKWLKQEIAMLRDQVLDMQEQQP